MSDQEQQGGRARYDRKAKNGSASSGPSTTGTSRSSRGKKKLSPLQPVQNRFSGQKKVDLPVDVWLMIAEHAHPYSLLQLSRTNKSFRRIFTSKELSSAIWNRALQNLEGFPNFQTTDFGEPRLVAFMYEDICAVCKKGETDRESYSMRIRLHTEGCGDKLIMQGRKMLLKIPAIREEVFLCIPKAFNWNDSSWDVKSRQYGCEFVVDEARKVNFDLHDHLSSSDSQHEAAAISTFVQEHKSRADADEADGEKLDTWMVEEILLKCWSRVADAIFEHHCQNSTIEMGSCHELVQVSSLI